MTGHIASAAARWSQVPQVAEVLDQARSSIDEVLWRRDIRGSAAQVAAASRVRGARESAAMEGADIGALEDSPMGRVLESAQAITGEAPAIVDVWSVAPLQALARLHAVVAFGHSPPGELGRPRVAGEIPDDPLHLGAAPEPALAARRLSLVGELAMHPVEVPALVTAGIAHGEVVSARPFTWGSGFVGRALVRVILAARGVDPSMFCVPEAGMMGIGRPAYVRALRAYEAGAVDEYLMWFAQAITLGAQCASAGVPGET